MSNKWTVVRVGDRDQYACRGDVAADVALAEARQHFVDQLALATQVIGAIDHNSATVVQQSGVYAITKRVQIFPPS